MAPFEMGYHPRSGVESGYRFFPKDPRFSIIAFILLVAGSFVIRRPEGMLCLFLYLVLLHILSGASAGTIWKHLRRIILFALLAIVLNAILVRGEPLVTIGGRAVISKSGLFRGTYFFLQILALYLSVVLFVSLTPHEAFGQGVAALIRPFAPRLADRAAFYSFLTVGFLPLFFEELGRIATLQKFRGGGLEGGILQKFKGARLLIVPLILSAIRRSGQLAMVVELRGLKESAGNLLVLDRPGGRDYAFIGTSLTVLVFCAVAF